MNSLKNGDTLENWLFKILKYKKTLEGILTSSTIRIIKKIESFCEKKLDSTMKYEKNMLTRSLENILNSIVYDQNRYIFIEENNYERTSENKKFISEIASASSDFYKEIDDKIKVLTKEINEQAISYAYEKTNTQNIYLLLAKAVHQIFVKWKPLDSSMGRKFYSH